MLIIYNPPGEFRCFVCRKWTADEDMKIWKMKPVCHECYKAKEFDAEAEMERRLSDDNSTSFTG